MKKAHHQTKVMESQPKSHVVMVSFPGQGHVNPLLKLAKRLASEGLLVTFSTTKYPAQNIHNTTDSDNLTRIGKGYLRYEFFSDGWEEEDEPKRYELQALMNNLETAGRDSFTQLIKRQFQSGRPVSCIINNPFISWVTDVAYDLAIPSAVHWVQSCVLFSIYYHYYHNQALFPSLDQPHVSVSLPGLPVLEADEIPSFLQPSCPSLFDVLKKAILGQFKSLSKAFCVLVDSFEELEHEAFQPLLNLTTIRPIGPLFKYTKEEKRDFSKDECLEWLDNQPLSSVVYVSFGSIVNVQNDQMKEIAIGLLNSGVRFMWIVREQPKGVDVDQVQGKLPDGFIQEAKGKGLVVPWCAQDRVLAHSSVACFVTHCGWNSALESLSCGVPVVAVPHFADQATNAKFLVDVFGVGVRLVTSGKEMEGISRKDVERCVVEVMCGPKAVEMKKNAVKWKKAVEEAVAPGGSSDQNVYELIQEIQSTTVK